LLSIFLNLPLGSFVGLKEDREFVDSILVIKNKHLKNTILSELYYLKKRYDKETKGFQLSKPNIDPLDKKALLENYFIAPASELSLLARLLALTMQSLIDDLLDLEKQNSDKQGVAVIDDVDL
jgi:hypothetical protein